MMEVKFNEKTGDLTLRCEFGNKLTRANVHGMFCAEQDCKCERRSVECMSATKAMFDILMGSMFSETKKGN